jgi:formamidopyrimidine-DNA glycosylase
LPKTQSKKQTPIKAALLDQAFLAGIGNWMADEALYQARIAPARVCATLDIQDVARLREAIFEVCRIGVETGADADQWPESWMFHHRWGGAKGAEMIEGHAIVRETIAGRTTAWVPSRQK